MQNIWASIYANIRNAHSLSYLLYNKVIYMIFNLDISIIVIFK